MKSWEKKQAVSDNETQCPGGGFVVKLGWRNGGVGGYGVSGGTGVPKADTHHNKRFYWQLF